LLALIFLYQESSSDWFWDVQAEMRHLKEVQVRQRREQEIGQQLREAYMGFQRA